MTRYTLHVPLVDNTGNPTPDSLTDWLEDQLDNIAGGWTGRVPAYGGYIGETGRRYREPIWLYHVDSDGDIRGAMKALADYLGGALDQEAVYLTESPITATLVTLETV